MGTIFVDNIKHQSSQGSGTITIGASGETIKAASGATLDVNGNELILDADANTSITADTDNQIDFKTNGSDRVRIDSVGNFKVSRNGATLNTNSSHQFVDDLSNSYSLMVSNKASSPASQYLMEVGFRSASPDDNNARFVQYLDSTTTRAEILSDGDFRSHDNSYGSTSDERIKQNIVDANSQWEDVKGFRIRNYKKKDDVRQYGEDKSKVHIGVIAQELETVSPGLIKEQEPSKGDILSSSEFGELYEKGDDIPEDKEVGDIKKISANVKSVNYSVLYMKAIKALQEAMTRIEELEIRIQTLENNGNN
jgi:hypothetical protein